MNELKQDILRGLNVTSMNLETLIIYLGRHDWEVNRDFVLTALDQLLREGLIRNVRGLYEKY